MGVDLYYIVGMVCGYVSFNMLVGYVFFNFYMISYGNLFVVFENYNLCIVDD